MIFVRIQLSAYICITSVSHVMTSSKRILRATRAVLVERMSSITLYMIKATTRMSTISITPRVGIE